MANTVEQGGTNWSKPLGVAALTIVLSVGGFFALTELGGSDSQRSDTFGNDVSQQCVEDTERIADERAQLVQELGADAPILDFNFPDSCFE